MTVNKTSVLMNAKNSIPKAGVAFKQQFQLASRTSRYKNQKV
jgi:hypothetical protein